MTYSRHSRPLSSKGSLTLIEPRSPAHEANALPLRHRGGKNGVKHVTSSPYHPRTNGPAGRIVRSFESSRKKCSEVTKKEIELFLMTYRITPHATTRERTAKLLIGRNLRTRY